jgi:hypothetical protein
MAVIKRRDFLEVIPIKGRIILKFILKKWFWNMCTAFVGSEWGPVMDYSKHSDSV